MKRGGMKPRAVLRRAGLAVAMATAGATFAVPALPAHAAVTNTAGQWLWEGTARTVNNVRDDVGMNLLPATVRPTGKGVGIALIDTGVAAVAGLTPGNVDNRP